MKRPSSILVLLQPAHHGLGDVCDTIDGRYMPAVNEYASTCDGGCMELTMHELMIMDPVTQLGYCSECIPNQPDTVRGRLEAVRNGTWKGPAY
jgi:hypothetical protein